LRPLYDGIEIAGKIQQQQSTMSNEQEINETQSSKKQNNEIKQLNKKQITN